MFNHEILLKGLGEYLPLIGLYAELHYRFKFTGSRYYQKEPEILADIPHRVEPGEKIPVLIIIKDSHQFPITLKNINITITQDGKILFDKIFSYNLNIKECWWDETKFIRIEGIFGEVVVQTRINYKVNGNYKTIQNHNYPLSSKKPLITFLSHEKLPNDGKIIYGDLHYHSNLTEDMVEFGAPLEATLLAAKAMGLNFFCNTDHSYDLDDKPGSWKETDPDLQKWNNSRQIIQKINNKYTSTFIIPSEELTLHNLDGRNIHALILNNEEFLPGAGDGAEEAFNFYSKYNTKSVQEKLEDSSLYIAAHPLSFVPILQWLFVKRGQWREKDLRQKQVAGLQILNGALDNAFYNGLNMWILLLLSGEKKFIFGGSDAHGNFNIFRQIKTPMISLSEKKEQIFGECRTGVYPVEKGSMVSVIDAMRKGNCFITNGPMVNIKFNYDGGLIVMGGTTRKNFGTLEIDVISSKEFGEIAELTIIKGIVGDHNETTLYKILNLKLHRLNKLFELFIQRPSYFRCLVKTKDRKGIPRIALSNPIWINPIVS